MENRYNLVEEDWIPVGGEGRVSLRRIFSESTLIALGGTPIQKISLIKLLLAIAQTACTPENDQEWRELGANGLAKRCLSYLDKKKDLFWLYGKQPFLQFPALKKARNQKGKELTRHRLMRSYLPDIPAENDTILTEIQEAHPLSDAEKAVFLISSMNYAPGGKRVENITPLSADFSRTSTAKAGPSLGNYVGYLNSCLWSDGIQNTLWLNLFTQKAIDEFFWEDKSVIPPWEEMPQGEIDCAAERIKKSIMGSLCAVSRFILFEEKGMIYADGIQYPSHTDGWRESFFSWYPDKNKDKFLWLNTGRKPWRELPALLNTPMNGGENTYNCPQVSMFWNRARASELKKIGVWSGGLQVRGTAGDQSVKQTDDFVESIILMQSEELHEKWFAALKKQMQNIEQLSKILFSSIRSYSKDMSIAKPEEIIEAYQYKFWEICERHFQDLVQHCEDQQHTDKLLKILAGHVHTFYNSACPNRSARQMECWAKHRPRMGRYFADRKEEKID